MDWGDIASIAGKAAPIIGTILGGPAGGAVGGLIASVFGVEAEPDKVAAAIAKDPDAMVKLKQIESEHERDLRRMVLEAETARLSQINMTMRAEALSGDKFVSRWRPLFGYCVAVTWSVQMAGLTYVIVLEPQWAAEIVASMASLSVMWGIALSVLGVNISARSKDKAMMGGSAPDGGLMGAIVSRISGANGG